MTSFTQMSKISLLHLLKTSNTQILKDSSSLAQHSLNDEKLHFIH